MRGDFGQRPTHLGGIARYLLQQLHGVESADTSLGDRARPELEASGLTATADRVRRYLEVTEGSRVPSLNGGGVLPPTFPSVWETGGVLDLLRIAGYPLPLKGLVHLENERVQLRPIAAADRLYMRLRIGWAERTRAGAKLGVESEIRDPVGLLCSTACLVLLLRGVEPRKGTPRRDQGEQSAHDPTAKWRTLRGWTLARSLGRRYAAVSGDVNPIHLFTVTARPFGFRSQILHGCCIEALVANALVESVLGGDPGSLRRITIRFTAPLELPAQVTLQTTERPGGGFFRVIGDPTVRPYAEGMWTGEAQG